jgi:transcriptional regulator with XRE-family HTH domain
MKTELMNLAKNVRRLRLGIHYSQEALAFESGLNRTYICDIERATRNLSFGSLLKVARGLRTTVSELTQDVDTAAQPPSEGSGNSSLAAASNQSDSASETNGSVDKRLGVGQSQSPSRSLPSARASQRSISRK